MKKVIDMILAMQKNAREEEKSVKGKNMGPGYKDYVDGWNDALETLSKEFKGN